MPRKKKTKSDAQLLSPSKETVLTERMGRYAAPASQDSPGFKNRPRADVKTSMDEARTRFNIPSARLAPVEAPDSESEDTSGTISANAENNAVPDSAQMTEPDSVAQSVPNVHPKFDIPSARLPEVKPEAPVADPLPGLTKDTEEASQAIKDFVADPVHKNYLSQLLNLESAPTPPPVQPDMPASQQIGRAIPRLLLPETMGLLDKFSDSQDPISAYASNALDSASGNFRDEAGALLDAGTDTITGNAPGGFMDQYRTNRDTRRTNSERQQAANPTAAALGQITGTLPQSMLFKGKSPGARIGLAGGIGGLQGAGASQADLTQGEIGQFGSDVLTGAGLLATLVGAGEGFTVARRAFKPKNLDAIAAHQRVLGAGDPAKAPMVDDFYEGELPASIRGFQNAQKKGFIRTEGSYVTNVNGKSYPLTDQLLTDPIQAGKQMLETAKGRASENVRRTFNKNSVIDYDKLRADLGNDLQAGRAEKLEMLKPIAKQTVTWDQMLGHNPSQIMLRTAQAVKALDENASVYGQRLLEPEIESLRFLREHLPSQKLTIGQLEEVSRNLGILTRNLAGKQLPDGSPRAVLRDTKIRIDNEIGNRLEAHKEGLGTKYRQKNMELHDTSEFLDNVKKAARLQMTEHGKDVEFSQGPTERIGAGAGIGRGGDLLGSLARTGLRYSDKALSGAAGIASGLLKPAPALWVSQLFQSYDPDAGTVVDPADIELFKHYVDISTLSPSDKARLKSAVNSKGRIDTSVIPKKLRKKAEDRARHDF